MGRNGSFRWDEADAINDPEVLWAVIEGLLSRLTAIPQVQEIEVDPIVHVLPGDHNHHRHPNCPLLIESRDRLVEVSEPPSVRRTVRSGATRAGLTECPACRTHRSGRRGA